MSTDSLRDEHEHFNELHALQAVLIRAAERFLKLCIQSLDAHPATADFEAEFIQVCRKFSGHPPLVV